MTAPSTSPPTAVRRPPWPPDGWTAAGTALALGCTLVGTFVTTPWKASGPAEWGVDVRGGGGWTALAVLLLAVALVTALVGLATARARAVPPERTARRALLLAVLGVASIVVFWTGAPPVLAGGATGLALDARRRAGRLPGTAAAALVLAVLTAAAAVHLAVTG